MAILYEGFEGAAADPVVGITFFVLSAAITLGAIIGAILEREPSVLVIIFFSVLLALFGYMFSTDRRIPIVKATINDTVPWVEINDKYSLYKQENELYIFEVKDTTNEEWEKHIKGE